MELETQTIARRRKEGPTSALATELGRPPWDLEDTLSKAKKTRLSTILFAENYEVTHRQLCELLKYAVLGKSTVPNPRISIAMMKTITKATWGEKSLYFHIRKLSLPPPTSNCLFDIIGLQKKKSARGFLGLLENFKVGKCPKRLHTRNHWFMLQKLINLGPLVSAILKSSINLQNDHVIQKYGCEKVGLTRCLLTQEEMKTFHFPLQGSPDCENFILTKCNGSITDSSPLFGLDSEMCLTSKGGELTRISLVAEGGHCIMDELVKPDFKILDCLTSFSEITKKILNPVTTKFKDVQKLLRELRPPDAVLVGHSLDLNLRVLKVTHPYVIDTSLLYIRKQGRRFKLRFLAKVILGKDIQCPDKLDHDTIEDARKTLELARYFLKYGPKKIAELNLEALASHKELRAASQASGNQEAATKHPNMSVLDCLDSMGQKLLFLTRDIDELSSSRNCQTIKCSSNKETKTKWTEMSAVYVGPFFKNCNIGAVKKTFNSLGPVQSITLVLDTSRVREIYHVGQTKICLLKTGKLIQCIVGALNKLYFCIQYEVLEAAQLAIETMNGILVEGSYIRVHRHVTEFTLECDTLVHELEQDSENQATIYVAGLEFKTRDSAQVALEILKGKDWKLKGRYALTPRHLQAWLKDIHPEPASNAFRIWTSSASLGEACLPARLDHTLA